MRHSAGPHRPLAPARGPRDAPACRVCGGALSALARQRGDVCDAMDCRRRAADALTRARREAEVALLRDTAARDWGQPALRAAPVLWLRHHAEAFAPPSPIDIAQLREHLVALEAEPPEPPALAELEPQEPPATQALATRLCTMCRGRCCRFGLHGKAFLRAPQLRSWVDATPGATWGDAVEHYVGHVAAESLESSCLFHGRQGCTLPRERRSQVCNEYACDTLEQLRDAVGDDGDVAVVVGVSAAHEVHHAAVLGAEGVRALKLAR